MGEIKEVIVATGNIGKFREFQRILGEIGIRAIFPKDLGLSQNAEETGETFLENAYIKAREFTRITGLCCVADDSGLCVDALGGEPGIFSARYMEHHSQEEKNKAILERLRGVPREKRSAHFESAVCFCFNDEREPIFSVGRCYGFIGEEPRGSEGFGYDPIFYVGERSVAQLSPEEKDEISHRGKSIAGLIQKLKDINL